MDFMQNIYQIKKYEESHSNVEHINYLKNKFPKNWNGLMTNVMRT